MIRPLGFGLKDVFYCKGVYDMRLRRRSTGTHQNNTNHETINLIKKEKKSHEKRRYQKGSTGIQRWS